VEVEVPDEEETSSLQHNIDQQFNKKRGILKNKLVIESDAQENRDIQSNVSNKNKNGKSNHDSTRSISVSEALKHSRGAVRVKGIIISKSQIYNFSQQEPPEGYVYSTKRYQPIPVVDHCAVDVEIIDTQYTKHAQVLKAVLQDDLVNDIRFAIPVIVTGEIRLTRISKTTRVNQLKATNLDYSTNENFKLSEDRITKIKEFAKNDSAVSIRSLLSLFEPNIIGLESVKMAILISLVNAAGSSSTDSFDNRFHILLTGCEKVMTILLKSAANLCNGIYTNLNTNSSPITVAVTKEDGKKILKGGQIVLTRNNLLALDLVEQLKKNEIGYLQEVMKEGQINVNSDEFKEIIPAYTTIIASMKVHDDSLYSKKVSTTKRIHDLSYNFDFICNCNLSGANRIQLLFHNDKHPGTGDKFQLLKDYVDYTRTLNPKLSEQAMKRISDYCIAQTGLTDTNRIKEYEKLVKTTTAIARFKFKKIAAEQESNEAIDFIESLKFEESSIFDAISLKEKIVNECVATLQTLASPTEFNRLIQLVCEANKMFQEYIGEKMTIPNNSKVREIAQILKNNPKIQILKEKPLVLKYIL